MAATMERTSESRWHHRYPELGTGPIPIEPYVSRDYYERERTQIFRKVWLNIGRVEQIPQVGDYFVKELQVCDTKILVVRGRDDRVRAFHNMCTHRGNQLIWDNQGNCNRFTCKFHGWTFALDGSLRGITDEEKYFNLDKTSLGMTPVAVDTWEGFIFVNVDPKPEQSLGDYLGAELRSALKGYDFTSASSSCASWYTDLNANWKLCKDAFHEAYHVSTLHRRTIGNVFAPKSDPYSCALDFTLFSPRHGRISLPANPEWVSTPVEKLAQQYGPVVLQKNVDNSAALPAGVNPTRHRHWAFDGFALFPNYIMYISAETYLVHVFWPLAHNRTRWEIRSYTPRAQTLAQRFSQEYGKVSFRDTLLEDGSTLERTQAMLNSGARQNFHLHDEELLIRQGNAMIEHYLNR